MNWERIREQLDNFKIPLSLSLVGIVLIIGGMISSGLNSGIAGSKVKEFPKESIVETNKKISVDISGAVLTPGVYQFGEAERVENAIRAAGGFAKNANFEYISKSLNLAQKLSDGMKIYIPFEGESGGLVVSSSVVGTNTQSSVNINSASQSQLEALPGIGPVTAAKIISGRPYQKIGDLLNQKIVGKSVFEKIKDSIVAF